MRPIVQLLFILFYFASSYAISQERVRLIVSEVQHSSSRDDRTQFDAGCKQLRNGFPNYQRAKPKTICSLCFGQNQRAGLFEVSERFFQQETDSHVSFSGLRGILPRAPPSQS